MELADIWPLFGLTIETPRLMMSPVRDSDLAGLARAALDGVHDPELTPFGSPWTDAPAEQLPRNLATYQWNLRGQVSPRYWNIAFAVHHDGRVIGTQDLNAFDFANRRTVNSGSWITQSAQGQGLGTEMRAALLTFAFDTLGAEWAESSAAVWNKASLAVSRKLGYEPNGIARQSPRPGQPVDEQRVRLPREAFVRPDWTTKIHCSDDVLQHLGIPTHT